MKVWIAVGLLALATASCSCWAKRPAERVVIPVEIRLAAAEMRPGWIAMDFADAGNQIYCSPDLRLSPGMPLYVSPEVGLSNGDMGAADFVGGREWAGEAVVGVRLTRAGKAKFTAFTSAHIGEHIATIVEGKVTSVRRVFEPIAGGQMVITGRFTQAQGRHLTSCIVPTR